LFKDTVAEKHALSSAVSCRKKENSFGIMHLRFEIGRKWSSGVFFHCLLLRARRTERWRLNQLPRDVNLVCWKGFIIEQIAEFRRPGRCKLVNHHRMASSNTALMEPSPISTTTDVPTDYTDTKNRRFILRSPCQITDFNLIQAFRSVTAEPGDHFCMLP
jgi:hypothetical protein